MGLDSVQQGENRSRLSSSTNTVWIVADEQGISLAKLREQSRSGGGTMQALAVILAVAVGIVACGPVWAENVLRWSTPAEQQTFDPHAATGYVVKS